MHTTFIHKQYRHLFAKAASVVWQNKLLIIPGLFVSLLANMGFFELFLGNADNLMPKFNWNFLLPIISFQSLITRLSALNVLATVLLFVLVALLVFGILLLSAWALAALVIFVSGLALEKPCALTQAITRARQFIWPVLFIAIVAKSISYISLNLISVPLLKLLDSASLLNYIFYFVAFIIFIALSVAVSVLMYYSILFLIIKKMPLIRAMESAFALFLKNWVTTLEFGFLLLLINLGTTLVFGLFASLLAFPFILFLIIAGVIKSQLVLLLATVMLLLVFMTVLLVTTGFVLAFYISSWTLLFLNLESNLTSKIHRLLHPFTFLYKKLFSR